MSLKSNRNCERLSPYLLEHLGKKWVLISNDYHDFSEFLTLNSCYNYYSWPKLSHCASEYEGTYVCLSHKERTVACLHQTLSA